MRQPWLHGLVAGSDHPRAVGHALDAAWRSGGTACQTEEWALPGSIANQNRADRTWQHAPFPLGVITTEHSPSTRRSCQKGPSGKGQAPPRG